MPIHQLRLQISAKNCKAKQKFCLKVRIKIAICKTSMHEQDNEREREKKKPKTKESWIKLSLQGLYSSLYTGLNNTPSLSHKKPEQKPTMVISFGPFHTNILNLSCLTWHSKYIMSIDLVLIILSFWGVNRTEVINNKFSICFSHKLYTVQREKKKTCLLWLKWQNRQGLDRFTPLIDI